jgi:1,4-dihydroxy-2-naphthoate polyprenyltransferase
MKDILTLLRFPFSFFLMPVFLFALSQSGNVNELHVWVLFIALHIFIYPSSNAYNSFMDQDESSIGGVKHPPKATKKLFYVSIFMDTIGLLLGATIGIGVFVGLLLYILASRLYSYRGVRLKKYPIIGFLTVVVFQGGFVFVVCQMAFGGVHSHPLAAVASSFLISGVYPLTQIYQHQEDKKDGVQTISILLGYRGTFLFSMSQFGLAAGCLFFYFQQLQALNSFTLFSLFLIPATGYFAYWMVKVWRDTQAASFDHAMRMNLIASASMNACFVLLIYLNHHG